MTLAQVLQTPLVLFRQLMPTEPSFVNSFIAQSALLVKAAEVFKSVLDDCDRHGNPHRELHVIEMRADIIHYKTMSDVGRIFMTPKGMDKRDIGTLSEAMDDVVNLMKDAAKRFAYHKVEFPSEIREMVGCVVRATRELHAAMPLLIDLEGNAEALHAMRTRVSAIESEADVLQEEGIRMAFESMLSDGGKLKMEKVYALVEEICDRCEDVSKIIDAIVSQAI